MTTKIKDKFNPIPIGSLVQVVNAHASFGSGPMVFPRRPRSLPVLERAKTDKVAGQVGSREVIPWSAKGLLVLDQYEPTRSDDFVYTVEEYKVLWGEKTFWIDADFIEKIKEGEIGVQNKR